LARLHNFQDFIRRLEGAHHMDLASALEQVVPKSVSPAASTADKRLYTHDLSTELVHPATIAEVMKSEQNFRDRLAFHTRYSLMVLAWSMPLALWATRVTLISFGRIPNVWRLRS
jgi:hypothetical protein